MADMIIFVILGIIVFFALKSTMKHFKGQGGCCGGGSVAEKPKKKRLQGTILATWLIHIEGMHCKNCKYRIEKALNELDGVVAEVDLKKNLAVIKMCKKVSEDALREVIEESGYTVTSIDRA